MWGNTTSEASGKHVRNGLQSKTKVILKAEDQISSSFLAHRVEI